MRIRPTAFLLLILALVAGPTEAAMPGASAAHWQRLVVAGTGLAVEMPGAATKGNDLTVGGMRSVVYRLETGEARSYDVRCEQMSASQIAIQGVDALFDNIRDGLLEDGTARAQWSLPARGGAVGRGLIIDSAMKSGPDSYTTIAYLYLRGDWLYELLATVPRGGDRDAAARRFLNSARFSSK
jgi:hypothetical protein